ncbi:hypothetical protein PHJA_001507300 [Phtheirospermum japonicum]|uniref:Uncharacterized protein n=1 Tax=Phtheirospermum japonicum TaxID=374723 RepID=A0A830C3I8_9LAMI|nr:hypothetical protein PHJA_001507300 [Phtheirospermum japonicum]
MGGFVYKPVKKLKLGKLVRKIKDCLGKLCSPAAPKGGPKDEELAFTTFIIKVNPSKAGWQKRVIKLLKNCKGARFKMDGEGVVEVSVISNPMRLMKKIGKSGKVELHWIQYGQCCTNLFMPEAPKKQQQQDATKKDSNNYYYNPNYAPPHPYNNNYGYNYNNSLSLNLPPSYRGGGDYGYHYQLPEASFNPYNYAPPPRYYYYRE